MHTVAKRFGALGMLLDRIEPIFFTEASRAERRDLVEVFRDHLARMDPESIGHCVDAVIFGRRDIRAELDRIRVPTSVLVGLDDVATPPAEAREIARRIPGAKLVEIAGAGHLSALEQPDRVTRELLAHFSVSA